MMSGRSDSAKSAVSDALQYIVDGGTNSAGGAKCSFS
jgi:hypothetical protein